MDSIGTEAEKLHTSIVNLVRGRGLIGADDLKREAAAISGHNGAAGNAVAAVAIKQLAAAGRIRRSASGRSYRCAATPSGRPGRPTTGTPVKVRLPGEAISYLDGLAAAAGVSRAEAMRLVVKDHMEQWG